MIFMDDKDNPNPNPSPSPNKNSESNQSSSAPSSQPIDSSTDPADSSSQSASTGSGNVKIDTQLANQLDEADDDPAKDSPVKKLLSYKVIAAMILKGCAEEFMDTPVETIINECLSDPPVTNPSSGGLLNGNDRVTLLQQEHVNSKKARTYFDNYFIAYRPGTLKERIPVRIDIEPQNDSNPGYPLTKRAFAYCSFMVTDEMVRKTADSNASNTTEPPKTIHNPWDAYDYNQVHKVYSIWICMDPNVADRNSIVRYRTVREIVAEKSRPNSLKKHIKEEPRANYDICEVITINLGSELDIEDPSLPDLINLLNLLFRNKTPVETKKEILQDHYRIAMSDTFKQEVNNVSSYAKMLVNSNAKTIAEKIILSNTQPANVIALWTGLSVETVQELADYYGVELPAASDTSNGTKAP